MSLRVKHLIAQSAPAAPTLASADFVHLNLDTYGLIRCLNGCYSPKTLPADLLLSRPTILPRVQDWLRSVVTDLGSRRAYPSLVLTLARIDRDYHSTILTKALQDFMQESVVFVGIEREAGESKDELQFEQMPYPPIFSLALGLMEGEPGSVTTERPDIWMLAQDRPYLFVPPSPAAPEEEDSLV